MIVLFFDIGFASFCDNEGLVKVLWLDFAISLGSIPFPCVELIISVIRRRFGANCGNIKPQHGLDEYERQKQAMDQISDIMNRVIS